MIEQLSTSTFMIVSDNGKPYVANGGQSSGELRRNVSTHQIEAFNGVAWIPIGQHINVGLSSEGLEIMHWARRKMKEEEKIERLMKDHPGVRELKEKLDLMIALTNKEQNGTN